jgi:hypothetical protein
LIKRAEGKTVRGVKPLCQAASLALTGKRAPNRMVSNERSNGQKERF